MSDSQPWSYLEIFRQLNKLHFNSLCNSLGQLWMESFARNWPLVIKVTQVVIDWSPDYIQHSVKFQKNLLSNFWVIMLTDKQTDKQTDTQTVRHRRKHNVITLYYIKVIWSGLKSKTAKPLRVHGVSVTMRTNERKDKFWAAFGKQQESELT